jgi:putative membrane protein
MLKLLSAVISGIMGLWLADIFVEGVDITGSWRDLLIIGSILGLINFYIKPILKLISLPLRLVTLGLFGIVINIAMVWTADILFSRLVISGLMPLLWTTLIVWGLGILLPRFFPKNKNGLNTKSL